MRINTIFERVAIHASGFHFDVEQLWSIAFERVYYFGLAPCFHKCRCGRNALPFNALSSVAINRCYNRVTQDVSYVRNRRLYLKPV